MLNQPLNWADYYEKRLDWAFKAKGDFIDSISNKSFRNLYNQNSSKTVNIAVYGQSQVGKTTLILKLIGIKEEYYEEVSAVLRADIPQGKSVTPTSIIYSKSEDQNFYYIEGDNGCQVAKNQLKEKLIELRTRVENNVEINTRQESQSNISIKIPLNYFNKKNSLDVNIIDLPGYGSANDKEQRHVKKVIEGIIPILNLVLIVSNKITDLVKSKKLCRQFRYVLTRSVSSDSVRKRFDNNLINDKKEYVEFVRKEFGEDLSRDIRIYPLEYGESWSNLNQKTKHKAEGIITELFEELREDISESSTPYNQLMQNANHYKYIEKMISHELEEFQAKIEAKEKELDNLESDFKKIKELSVFCIKKNERLLSQSLHTSYTFTYNVPSYNGEITVTKLESFLTSFIQNICTVAHQEWKKIIENCSDISWEPTLGFHEISNKEASLIRSTLNGYKLDWYFPFNDSAIEDKKKCEAVRNRIYRQIKSKIETSFEKEVERHNNIIDQKIKKNEKRIAGHKNETLKNLALTEKVNEEIVRIKTEKEQFEKESKKDLETAKKFEEHLKQEYVKEKNKTIEILNNRESPMELKFLNFIYLSLLLSECRKLINQPL